MDGSLKNAGDYVDILILHGLDIELVEDLKEFFNSFGLSAETVLNLASLKKDQNKRVTYRIKKCGIPLVLLTFDENEKNSSKSRPNVYDEITRCQTYRPKDTIVLREVKNNKRVELQSNVEGKLVILEFNRTKLHKLFPFLINELRVRGLLNKTNQIDNSAFNDKLHIGVSLNSFLEQMDYIWEKEFDIASNKIDRKDSETLEKYKNYLDKFFWEYWKVFTAILRDKKNSEELKPIYDTTLSKSWELAANIWEAVANTFMRIAEDIKTTKSRDKKFDSLTFDKYYRLADSEFRKGNTKQEISSKRIQFYKNCIQYVEALLNKIGR